MALAATTALGLVLAVVAANVGSAGDDAVGTGYRSCTPTQSPALDVILAVIGGVCALVAVLGLVVYPSWWGRRREQGARLGEEPLEPLLGEEEQERRHSGQAHRRLQQQPSRRLKLLIAFSCMIMAVGAGRCILRLSRYARLRFAMVMDDASHRLQPRFSTPRHCTLQPSRANADGNDASFSYLAFIDAALTSLVGPVLCFLYALERDLYVYVLLRRGGRRVRRWRFGVEKGRGGEMKGRGSEQLPCI